METAKPQEIPPQSWQSIVSYANGYREKHHIPNGQGMTIGERNAFAYNLGQEIKKTFSFSGVSGSHLVLCSGSSIVDALEKVSKPIAKITH